MALYGFSSATGNRYNLIDPRTGRATGSANIGVTSTPSAQAQRQVLGASTLSGGGSPAPAPAPLPDLGFEQAAQSEHDALLSSLNSEYDFNRANLERQLGFLGTQKENQLSSLETEMQGLTRQVGRQKERSKTQTQKNVQDARSSAQDVERRNRNMLRGLGILNSSAAGDILSRPFQEFDQQRGELIEANVMRIQELDDFMNQKTAEHANAVREIQSQYADLVARIQNDLRFNDRQRVDAIKSANAALQARMAEIRQAQFNYASQVNTLKQNISTQLSTLSQYQAPTADTSAIASQTLSLPTNSREGFSIYNDDEENNDILNPLSSNFLSR